MWYTVALFIHVLGVIGLFVAVGLVDVAYVQMRRAVTLDQLREWATTAQFAGKSIVFTSLVVLIPAVYMVIVAWRFTTPWVAASLITVIALAILGATVSGRTIERIAAMAQTASPGPVPHNLRAALAAPHLWLIEGARLTLLVGIVFLMTVKPELLGSLLALVTMLLLGVITGLISRYAPSPTLVKE
ncbi:MAG: hypothetical protein ACXVCX_06770 [Ktedonobacterales bacterium]